MRLCMRGLATQAETDCMSLCAGDRLSKKKSTFFFPSMKKRERERERRTRVRPRAHRAPFSPSPVPTFLYRPPLGSKYRRTKLRTANRLSVGRFSRSCQNGPRMVGHKRLLFGMQVAVFFDGLAVRHASTFFFFSPTATRALQKARPFRRFRSTWNRLKKTPL